MQIGRKIKEIVAKLPPECPECRSKSGAPTLCDMCLGVRELKSAMGVPDLGAYSGHYVNGRWVQDIEPK